MKASKLVMILNKLIAKHGDQEVLLSGWPESREVSSVKATKGAEATPKKLVYKTSYIVD